MIYKKTQPIKPRFIYENTDILCKQLTAIRSRCMDEKQNVLGEHFSDSAHIINEYVTLTNATHTITDISWNIQTDEITITAKILDTPIGKIIQNGINFGIEYEFKMRVLATLNDHSEVNTLNIITFDIFIEPSLDTLQEAERSAEILFRSELEKIEEKQKLFNEETHVLSKQVSNAKSHLKYIQNEINIRKKEEKKKEAKKLNNIVNTCIGDHIVTKLTELCDKYGMSITDKLRDKLVNIDYMSNISQSDVNFTIRNSDDGVEVVVERDPWSDRPIINKYYINDGKIDNPEFYEFILIDLDQIFEILWK